MKISIITPVYNGETFLAETMQSILSQRGNFELEYIVIDGESKDNTLSIVNKYKDMVENGFFDVFHTKTTMQIISEKDNGMYDALGKGLKLCTGDIVAYLNADDFYISQTAFKEMLQLFCDLPEVKVAQGCFANVNEEGFIFKNKTCLCTSNNYIINGLINGGFSKCFIQQESTFWRRELHEYIDYDKLKNFKLAGDFYLWYCFAQHTKFYFANILAGAFRLRSGQLSSSIQAYYKEVHDITGVSSLGYKLKIQARICRKEWGASTRYHQKNGLIYYNQKTNKYCYRRKNKSIFSKLASFI